MACDPVISLATDLGHPRHPDKQVRLHRVFILNIMSEVLDQYLTPELRSISNWLETAEPDVWLHSKSGSAIFSPLALPVWPQ